MSTAALSKVALKTSVIEAMYNEILANTSTYYYYLGRSLGWDNGQIISPFNSVAYETLTRNEIVFLKKITSADVSFVVRRYNWEKDKVFDQYDDKLGEYVTHPQCIVRAGEGTFNNKITTSTTFDRSLIPVGSLVTGGGVALGARVIAVDEDEIAVSLPHLSNFDGELTFTTVANSGAASLEDSQFYCVTSDLNVYKCIFNNNNSPSTVKPYGNTFELLQTADGYVWKYLYTIPTSSVNRFMSLDDMPVTVALNNQYYSKGSITSVIATNYGSGYTGTVSLTVQGNGHLKDNVYRIASVIIENTGSGYSFVPEVTFSDPIDGVVEFQTETFYSLGEFVKVPATSLIYEVMAAGTTSNYVPNHTSGDLVANGTAVLRFAGKTLIGTAVVEDSIVTNVILEGMIGYVNLSSQGNGYDSNNPPIVSFASGGAKAVAEVVNGKVARVKILERGDGYTSSTTVSIEPPHSGQVLTTSIIEGGSYSTIPSVTIPAPASGTQASAYALMEISSIAINSGGTSWEIGDTFTVDLSDAAGTVEAIFEVIDVDDGAVTEVSIAEAGTYATLTAGSLTGVTTTQVVGSGGVDLTVDLTLTVKSLYLTGFGSGYKVSDLTNDVLPITFSDGDAEAEALVDAIHPDDETATANVEVYYGWGYSSYPTISVQLPEASVIIPGSVYVPTSVFLTDYTTEPNQDLVTGVLSYETISVPAGVTISVGENSTWVFFLEANSAVMIAEAYPTAASLSPIVVNGQITGAIVNDPGVGYTTASISISANPAPDYEAVLVPNLSYGDLDTRQANIELMAVPGTVDSIVITSPGLNYVSGNVAITVEGDGEGCVINSSDITVTDGAITQIKVSEPGRGYSYANVVISEIIAGGNGIVPAYARAVISPIYGHGRNAIRELCARDISLSTAVTLERNQGVRIDNDYRQLGIIKNPSKFNSTERYSALSGSTCYSVTGMFNLNYLENDMILWTGPGSGNRVRVISIPEEASAPLSILVVSLGTTDINVGDRLFYQNDSNVWEGIVVEAVIKPNVDKYSGDVMLIDNRSAFQPSSNQTISIKTAIRL